MTALASAPAAAQPTIAEPGWQLIRTDALLDPQSARLNPKDGRLYVLRIVPQGNGGGLYRLEADGTATLVASADRPRAVLVDPADGDIFHAEAGSGKIFRTAFGAMGRSDWVIDFGDPDDDDPIGMTLVPDDYTGSVALPGEALVTDEGNGGPREVWAWSTASPGGETLVQPDTGAMLKPVDVAAGRNEIYVCDQDADGIFNPGVGALFRLDPGGVATMLVPSVAVNDPRGIAVDPTNQDLLVLDTDTDRLLRIDPLTLGVSNVLTGLSLIPQSETAGLEATADGLWLVVTDRGADAVYTYARDPGAPAFLPCGATQAADVAGPGQIVFREFNALAGDVVGLTTAPQAGATGSSRLVLLAPDGSRVGLSGEFAGCDGRCESDPLPATGTYRVALYEDGHDGSGLFNVSLESLAGGLGGSSNEGSAPVCAGADGVRHLDCGSLATGTFDAPGDSDAYTFLGEMGETWRITTGELSFSGVLPRVALSAPDGSPVDLNGSAAFCAGACTSVALPANGTYTVIVAEDTLAATGDYEIRVEEVSGGSPACTSACSDGIDNDGNGFTDYPNEPGCLGPDDFSELRSCSDGVDNDGDGLTDYPNDPGCAFPFDFTEDPACDDGRDNDGDGLIDWDGGGFGAPDPFCDTPSKTTEQPKKSCGLGFELAFALPALMVLRRRRRSRRDA